MVNYSYLAQPAPAPGSICFLPDSARIGLSALTNRSLPPAEACNHPVLVASVDAAERLAAIYIISSFGGRTLQDRFPVRNEPLRLSHIPIVPAEPHPDTKQLLRLRGGGRMKKPSWLKAGKLYWVPVSVLQPWSLSLTPESLALVKRAGPINVTPALAPSRDFILFMDEPDDEEPSPRAPLLPQSMPSYTVPPGRFGDEEHGTYWAIRRPATRSRQFDRSLLLSYLVIFTLLFGIGIPALYMVARALAQAVGSAVGSVVAFFAAAGHALARPVVQAVLAAARFIGATAAVVAHVVQAVFEFLRRAIEALPSRPPL